MKLGVAARLAEWLGPGTSAHIGSGGYSTSHEGMVHVFQQLMPRSSRVIKRFMEKHALGKGETLKSAPNKEFVRTEGDHPYFFPYFGSLHLAHWLCPNRAYTYRAIVSDVRQTSKDTCRGVEGMSLLPARRGIITVGTLDHVYCRRWFGKNRSNVISRYSQAMLPPSERVVPDSPHLSALVHRTALVESIPQEDRVWLAPHPEARKAGRTADLAGFLDKAGMRMAKAERMVKRGEMKEGAYHQLCNRLMRKYSAMGRSSLR